MKWINVKERLPDKINPILIWAPYLKFPISVHWLEDGTYGEPGFFEESEEHCAKEKDITHWTPLLEPPND